MNGMKFVHEDNIKNKIKTNYNGYRDEFVAFYNDVYMVTRNKLLSLDYAKDNDEVFIEATNLINEYYVELEKFADKYNVSSQSKFRSSFLEEVSNYLFLKNEFIVSGELCIYNKDVYAGMKIGNDLKLNIIKKNVDFCIGKKVSIFVENVEYQIILPIICVEVKTYLDATMFGEVQFSSKLLKSATPNVKTYVLMETNEVGSDKIISARYDKVVNELFVLRKNDTSIISYQVLKDYYEQICIDIKNISIDRGINVPRLIEVSK